MAAKRTTLVASQAWTAGGNSIDLDVLTGSMMYVAVPITAGSGTVSPFNLWMEGSVDGGASWFRLIADLVDASGTDVTTPRANIVNNKVTNAAPETYGALYRHLPCDKVRARWGMAGTTPSLTFGVFVGVK